VENRKIRNATPLTYDGIHFRSKAEASMYRALKEEGFDVKYEGMRFILSEGVKPTVPFYSPDNHTRNLKLNDTKMKDITYTPDITFNYAGHLIVIEVKGMLNDVYPYKRKLFRKWLEYNMPNCVFFELHTKRQLMQAVEIIRQLDN